MEAFMLQLPTCEQLVWRDAEQPPKLTVAEVTLTTSGHEQLATTEVLFVEHPCWMGAGTGGDRSARQVVPAWKRPPTPAMGYTVATDPKT